MITSPTLAETIEHDGGDGSPPAGHVRLYRDLLLREAMDLSPIGRALVQKVIATVDGQLALASRILNGEK